MFKKLEEKADEIEKGLNRHQNSYLFALSDYHYHNKETGLEILEEKKLELNHMTGELTDFIEENNKFESLIAEFEELSNNVEEKLKKISFSYGLEDCLFTEESFDLIEINEDSSKTSSSSQVVPYDSPKVFMRQLGGDVVPQTPAISSRKSHLI